MSEFLQLDLPPILAAALAGLTCGLLGSFLLLRRESLLGDAISHAVLPGIVLGFAVTGARTGWPMLVGAMLAALLATLAITALRRAARLEAGAATGIVFTGFFALGLVLLEATGAREVHLDVDCVLFGQIETLVWAEGARGVSALFDVGALTGLPRQLGLLAAVAAAAVAFVLLAWRPLLLLCFDPEWAAVQGWRVRAMEVSLNLLVAAAAVAAFEAVGSILVVAMLICPAAAVRLLAPRYGVQVWGGAALGAALGVLGVALAGPVPAALGATVSVSAAGMIGALGGLAVLLAAWRGAIPRSAPRPA